MLCRKFVFKISKFWLLRKIFEYWSTAIFFYICSDFRIVIPNVRNLVTIRINGYTRTAIFFHINWGKQTFFIKELTIYFLPLNHEFQCWLISTRCFKTRWLWNLIGINLNQASSIQAIYFPLSPFILKYTICGILFIMSIVFAKIKNISKYNWINKRFFF